MTILLKSHRWASTLLRDILCFDCLIIDDNKVSGDVVMCLSDTLKSSILTVQMEKAKLKLAMGCARRQQDLLPRVPPHNHLAVTTSYDKCR